MADPSARAMPRIAFVFGDASLAEHVREAVAGHADIAYAVPAREFDPARLVDARVAAALVNVDDGDWFDDIEARLDAAGVPVVINDPDYSQGLEGWDRARWLRHLTAKLCGTDDFDPPRPAPTVAAPDAASEVPAMASTDIESGEPVVTAASVQGADLTAGEADPHSGDAVAERPLSPREIETLTADFVAAPAPHTEAVSTWQPTAVAAVHVSTEPFAAAGLAEPALLSEPTATPEPAIVASELPVPPVGTSSPDDTDASTDLLDVDTEALSAMIDERLAQPEPTGLHAGWDAPAEVPGDSHPDAPSTPQVGDASVQQEPPSLRAAEPAMDPDADVLASLPSLDDWQLLDADAVPDVVKPAARPVAPALPDSLSGITLVPMDDMGPAIRTNVDPIERWIDEAEGRTKPKGDGDKA